MLTRLQPGSGPVDPLELVFEDSRDTTDPPWVMFNMVSSVDGATAVKGGSTALNDEDDKALFSALRTVPDVVLVGAETVRAEGYGPIGLDRERRALREAHRLQPIPRLAIATRTLSLDPTMRVFEDRDRKPLIITGLDAPEDRMARLSGLAEIVQLPSLDASSIVNSLGDVKIVLCEGGPSLNGQLIADGLIDEMNLTVSPLIAGGESPRVAHGAELSPPAEMRLDRVLMGDRALFVRYVRSN